MSSKPNPQERQGRAKNTILTADDRLWGAFWNHKRGEGTTRFRIRQFCEDAVREMLPPPGWRSNLPDIGELWENGEGARVRGVALPEELHPVISFYAMAFNITKSTLICTVIRRKQEREGISLP